MSEETADRLRRALAAELDETDVPRLWRGVEQRRAHVRARRRAWRRARPVAIGVAALAIVLTSYLGLGRDDTDLPARVVPAGPLRTAAHEPLPDALPAGRTVRLDDGSSIRTSERAQALVLANSGQTFVLQLVEGAVEIEVRPGGPRRWSVEAANASVEVVGTRFGVRRDGARVMVRVSRGAVLVRHPALRDGIVRLRAGESVTVEPPRIEPEVAQPVAPEAPAPIAPEPALERAEVRPRSSSPRWRDHAARGEYDAAYSALGTNGAARESRTAGPAELMQLADVALLSGHPAEAVTPLRELLRRFPTDETAPLAAFTLGRIELDRLGQPADAARHFDLALRSGLATTLVDDARARLAIARQRSGDHDGARRAACNYLELAPNGPRAAQMRALCESE